MNFLKEINNLPASPEQYSQNYQSNFNWFLRKVVFLHSIFALLSFKKMQQLSNPIKNHLKNIKYQDSSEFLSKELGKALTENLQQGATQLTGRKLISMITNTFKASFFMVILLFSLQVFLRILFSIFIFYLLTCVCQGDYKKSYMYVGLICSVWLLCQVIIMQAFSKATILAVRIKSSLVMLLYSKVSSLTLFSIRATQTGKITNLLSNDLGTLQANLPIFLNCFSFPIYSIGLALLLIHWFGWAGILGLVTVALSLPISNLISKQNGKIIEEMNSDKDERIYRISEVIEGIRYIKLYGWEIAFKKSIEKIRNLEIGNLITLSFGRSFERTIGNIAGLAGGLVVFMVAHYQGKVISVPMIFAALQAILSFKLFMRRLNIGLGFYYEIHVIAQKFANLFNIKCSSLVKIDALTNTPSLHDITVSFEKGFLYGIAGKIGSGKSGLLAAILGEVPFHSGKFLLKGTISYVEQQPVLFSTSVRNNILFGLPYNETAYNRVIYESCLKDDLDFFKEGDQTLVGERGVAISGGQKARLSLARALYADSDIYLMDDPLSAVDSKVAKQINDRCLMKLKKEKTIILVTHQISYLNDCDIVIIMEGGKVSKKGSPSALAKQLQEMSCALSVEQKYAKRQSVIEEEMDKEQDIPQYINKNQYQLIKSQQLQHTQSQITLCTFVEYLLIGTGNKLILPLTVLLFILAELTFILFLEILVKYNDVKESTDELFQGNFTLFWEVLCLLIILFFIFNVLKSYCLERVIINSNKHIHQNMVLKIVRSPCAFFDKTSVGSLHNKFSNDLGILDSTFPFVFLQVMEGTSSRIISIISICVLYPVLVFILPIFILIFISMAFLNYFSPVIIECKRIDLQNKNPIYQTFNETINGLTQVRIYHRRKDLILQFSKMMNKSTKALINCQNVSRGFGMSIFMLGWALVLTGMMMGINQISSSNYENYAATILLLITFTENFQYILRLAIYSQSLLLSYVRVCEIIQLGTEKDLRNNYDSSIGLKQEVEAAQLEEDLHLMWPNRPYMEMVGLSARYSPELPLCITNISLKIPTFSRIGIVGRTGAGKSSIVQAIFRIIEPEAGSRYSIDNFNAMEVGLHSLRQHISIIPQTPYLFRGSIRFNIDPFDSSSEDDVWKALEDSGLRIYVKSLPHQLNTAISNSSESFSVGQKQLLCLARALLRRNRFLVLDEATSNVDMQTDAFIQKTIREKYTDTTVITIAHRLSTIVDYDSVIVMQKGAILEMGPPYELIQKKGAFYDMVRHTGKSADNIISKAKSSYKGNVNLRKDVKS